MAEDQESGQQFPKSVADLSASPYGKTEERFIKQGRPYTAEYSIRNGGTIGSFIFHGKAAMLQGFSFDKAGELDMVIIEKRLLDREPTSGDDGAQLFDEQSIKKFNHATSATVPPVYRSVLERQPDGKFAVSQRITTNDLSNWTNEYTNFNERKK